MRIVDRKPVYNESDESFMEVVTIYGTSTESKPTQGIATGSCFIEVNTGKAFLYNEAAEAWVEQGA